MDWNLWKKRKSNRLFSDRVDQNLYSNVMNLCALIRYIPIQEGKLTHFWILLDPNDVELKQFICRNITVKKNKEIMKSVEMAPYVLLGIRIQGPMALRNKFNVGFHAGILYNNALQMGLNVMPIGCNEGMPDAVDEFQERIFKLVDRDHIIKKYNNDKIWLDICLCLGYPDHQDKVDRIILDNNGTHYYKPDKSHQSKPSSNFEPRKDR